MTAGYILGKAAALFDQRHVTLVKSYGPESRGGASSAQVIISDEEIDYPRLIEPRLLVAMSQEAYAKYIGELASGGPFRPPVSPSVSWATRLWPTL